ncbi:MAG: hypothetical protein ACLUNV_10250 [Sutterella wadsworthensis]
MITRRQFIGAAGLMTVAATAPAFAYESRWPKKPSVPTDLNAEEFFTELAEKGSGFVVGNEKADTVVMMTFDTQCRWCVWEYEQFKPFLDRVKFVWHPVAVLNPWSELQGAAILAAKDPKAMFLEHEAHMKDAVFKGLDVARWKFHLKNARQCGPILRYSAVPRPEGAVRRHEEADGGYVAVCEQTGESFAKLLGK